MKNIILTLLIFIGVTSAFAQLPDNEFDIDGITTILITDTQNDFLSPHGVTSGVVGESVIVNNKVKEI